MTLTEAEQDESWTAAITLAATISEAELLDDTLSPERLLYRLFHTEGVAADRPRASATGAAVRGRNYPGFWRDSRRKSWTR